MELQGRVAGEREVAGDPLVPVSEPAGIDDDGHHDDGHQPQRAVHAVDEEAEEQGHKDVERRREGHRRVRGEGAGGELQEHGHNQDQRQNGNLILQFMSTDNFASHIPFWHKKREKDY